MPIPSTVVILDAGNSIIKGKHGGLEVYFPHAYQPLTEAEYTTICMRAGDSNPLKDYMRINGKPYVFGESAEYHGLNHRRTGAARYSPDYYGLFVAATLFRLLDSDGDVALFGSHAPGDVAYRDDLMRSAVGEWHVEFGERKRRYRVTYANTFDEPVGGLMNVLLMDDGLHYQRNDIRHGRTLVIDIGGHTTDWLAVKPGGEVDYSLNISRPLGINEVLDNFERSFRANNREATKGVTVIPPSRLREALRTGVFVGGGRQYDCSQEVKEATNYFLNQINATYQQVAGGSLPWDAIILTGGGSALLFEHLLPLLAHQRVMLADEAAAIHLANVRGGAKLWKLYEANGLL